MLGAYGGPGSPPVAMELSPQNAVNVVAMGADNQGRVGASGAINRAITEAKNRGYCRVYLPAGRYLIDDTIISDSLIWLQGDGMATYLRAKPKLNAPMIEAYWEPDVRWGYMQRISDLRLDGNRDEQDDPDGTLGYGIKWWAPSGAEDPILENELVGHPYVTSESNPGQWFDSNRDAFNLWISYCSSDGINLQGRGGGHFHNITAYECKGNGFRPTYDTSWANCTAGRNGKSGWHIAHSAIKIVSSKAWWSGYRMPEEGWNLYASNGFSFANGTRGSSLVGCEAQDNYANGFSFDNCNGHSAVGCIADSNNRRRATSVGVDFFTAIGNRFEGLVYDRYTDNYRHQPRALRFRESSLGNSVKIMHRHYGGDASLSPSQFIAHFSDDTEDYARGNDIDINCYNGYQTLAPGTLAPTPYHGRRIKIGLSGDVTINHSTSTMVHEGAEMTFFFQQDGTGGRTVTFSSDFDTGTGFTASTAANSWSTISFFWNSFRWIKTSEITGV